MTEKRFTASDKWIKDNCIGKLLNIDFNTITDANLCCELLNQIETEKRNNGKFASKLLDENEQLKSELSTKDIQLDFLKDENKHMRDLVNENEELKKENQRMTDKLNELALEFLNYDMVTMGKATEISEMCYYDFLKYRKDNGNPMELQL